MRFYGIGLEDVNHMELDEFNKMVSAMDRIKAKECLEMIQVISYPHTDNKNQNKIHKDFYKKAYPEYFEMRVIKNEDLRLV